MKLTIDRTKWGRGLMQDEEGYIAESRLIIDQDSSNSNEEAVGKMCCLGFLALRCGFKKSDVEGVCMPHDLHDKELHPTRNRAPWESMLNEGNGYDSELALVLAKVNDAPKMRPSVREAKITRLMKKAGIEVTFIN